MSDNTGIEWTDATWNPVTGCTKVSAGCAHCYAETFAERFRGVPGHHFENGFDVTLRPERLDQPLRWRRPRRIFVNSMSDLFHADVPDEYIARVFAVMALAPQHTFQILTKRHARMRSLLADEDFRAQVAQTIAGWLVEDDRLSDQHLVDAQPDWYPLRNVWLGVSVENQQWADIRIPALLGTSAAVRFLSCEPLLGPVDLVRSINVEPLAAYHFEPGGIDWVIVGGESGHGARPMHPGWARLLRDQCIAAGVPFLFKQWGEWGPAGTWRGPDHHLTAAGVLYGPGQHTEDTVDTAAAIHRWGKRRSGRVLDGRTWDEYPHNRTEAHA